MCAGTCRLLSAAMMAARIAPSNGGSSLCPTRILIINRTRSSLSCGRHWPTHIASSMRAENTGCSSTRTPAAPRGVQHAVAGICNREHISTLEMGRGCEPAAEDYVPLRARVHGDEVVVPPHAWARVVVRLEELAPARVIAPEAHRGRRICPCTDKLAREAGF